MPRRADMQAHHADKKAFTRCLSRGKLSFVSKTNGGVAQLGERLNGIQEVMGSTPTVSIKKTAMGGLFCLCAQGIRKLCCYPAKASKKPKHRLRCLGLHLRVLEDSNPRPSGP